MARTLIIAEAGVNHNGKLDMALQLCDAAKAAGVDVVKFQTWKTDLVITNQVKMADYQFINCGVEISQYEMLKQLELSYDDFVVINQYCNKIGIKFLSTADEKESLDFLLELGMPYIKLGSGDITNIPFLRFVASKHLPVILSTGMSNLGEVERAYHILLTGGASDVILLHCTTNYPCPMGEVNLQAMQTLKEAFKCKVGYSDHTMGIEIPVAAVAMGASVIEKHFTLNRALQGPDHKASLEPQELTEMVRSIRNVEQALGDGIKRPNESEQKISKVVLKRIVAKTFIEKGTILTEENMAIKRAEKGLPAYCWDWIVGKKAKRNYKPDDSIEFDY